MLSIKSLLLHKNLLAKWQDVECAATPGNLEWLTLYGNPITSQPEYQAWRLHLQSVPSLVEVPELGTEWPHIVFTFCPAQMHVLRVATALVALDLRVLTDEEHLAAQTGQTGSEGRQQSPGGHVALQMLSVSMTTDVAVDICWL